MGRAQKDIMKQWLIPAVVLIAVGLTGIGVGWSINEWQEEGEPPADQQARPSATPNPVLITGTEAAAIAENWVKDRQDGSYNCGTEEFNRASNDWIVRCRSVIQAPGLAHNVVLGVDATTRAVTLVP